MTQQTILEGSTFCICDELGDVRDTTHGLFADDTRFLSRLELTIDGKRPMLLSSGNVEYFSAAYFLRNPLTDRLPLDCAIALTTISSMFTCGGRVRAKRTQSATSSGVTGSRPA